MRESVLSIDVTDVAGLGEPLQMTATVCLPDDVSTLSDIVCFAWPGGGYNRRYFTFDMPDSSGGGEAGFHTSRGWIFIAIDSLNTGESSYPSSPAQLSFEVLASAMDHVASVLVERLAAGTLVEGLRPIVDPVKIGLGQSLGGSLVVLTQGQKHTFDAVAILGFSGHHTLIWAPPELVTGERVYIPRGTAIDKVTPEIFTAAMPEMAFDERGWPVCSPGFHWHDVPEEIVAVDMLDYPTRRGNQPEWGTATTPPCAVTMMSPGAISPEAASIRVPVFIGAGEMDTVPFPKQEPTAYKQSSDITVFVVPSMAHMHNFASTREQMWARVHIWAEGVAALAAL